MKYLTFQCFGVGAFKGGDMSEDASALIDSTLKLFVLWAELLFSFPLWKYYPTKKRKVSELEQTEKLRLSF